MNHEFASKENYFRSIDSRIRHMFLGEYVWQALDKRMDFEPGTFGSAEKSSIGKNARIGKGTLVKPYSVIENGVFIGENCTIGPNAYLRAGTIILDNCEVRAEVKNSILMNGVKAHHSNSCILDSILGENVNIAAGYVSANLTFGGKNVTIGKSEGIDTLRRKFGAIIGDNSKTGILSGTMPGTLIGHDSSLYPGTIASGIFPPKSAIRANYWEKTR